jgi:hypothetical protein
MAEYGLEISTIAQQEKFLKPTICRNTDANRFFGTLGTLSGEGHNNKQYPLQ